MKKSIARLIYVQFVVSFTLLSSMAWGQVPGNLTKTSLIGYTQAGYVLDGTTLEYRLDFTNTSGAMVDSVTIIDALVSELLPGSISVIDSSEAYTLDVDVMGVMTIIFDDIQLTDSATDASNSTGFITFSVDFINGLQVGDFIENRALLFLDTLPFIQSNTVINRIYDCAGITDFSGDQLSCIGDSMTFVNSEELVEEYLWTLDGDTLGTDSILTYHPDQVGTFWMVFTATNPLCNKSDSLQLTIDDVAPPTLIYDQDGDSLYVLDPEPDLAYGWTLNGNFFPNPDGTAVYDAMDQLGVYVVTAVSISTGCGAESNAIEVVLNLSEHDYAELSIFPNPVHDVLQWTSAVVLDGQTTLVEIYDTRGRLANRLSSDSQEVDVSMLVPGSYYLRVMFQDGISASSLFQKVD